MTKKKYECKNLSWRCSRYKISLHWRLNPSNVVALNYSREKNNFFTKHDLVLLKLESIIKMSSAHSPTFPSLHLRHSSLSNPSVASPTAHYPTFPSLHLRHNSFSNPSIALHTSQLILKPFRCFTYITDHSPTLLSLLLRHRLFTYVTRRAVRVQNNVKHVIKNDETK